MWRKGCVWGARKGMAEPGCKDSSGSRGTKGGEEALSSRSAAEVHDLVILVAQVCSTSIQCRVSTLVSVWTKVSTAEDTERRVRRECTCAQGRPLGKGRPRSADPRTRARCKESPGRGREATLTLSCSSRLKLRASWSWTSSSGPQDGGWRRESMRGQGRGRQRQSNRQRGRPKRDRGPGPGLSKIREGDTASPRSIKMGRGRKKLCA